MTTIPAAAKGVPKAIPPSSTFGELLRRSKFASYDPSIRQAYAAPPSYVHRGNWGLKRPIANRSRRGAIVLRKFEEHAQYIEWNRAEHQVKVIKSVEEMGVTPTLVPQTSWFIGLGQGATATESGFDSDFCPGENPEFERVKDLRYEDEMRPRVPVGFVKDEVMWEAVKPSSAPASSSSSSSSFQANPIVDLSKLGDSGKGAYGAKARVSVLKKEGDDALLQPNIQSMTPVEFQRYLEKLRKLRPEFLKYMRAQLEKDWKNNHRCIANTDPQTVKDEDLVFTFAGEARLKYLHMGFLGRYTNETMFKEDSVEAEAETEAEVEVKTEAEAKMEGDAGEEVLEFDPIAYAEDLGNRPSPIRKRPHKLGGLMYATPTALESFLFVKPSSGLILQEAPKGTAHSTASDSGEWVAAFGGMTSRLRKRHAGSVSPLYSSADGGMIAPRIPDPSSPGKITFFTEQSERKMRVIDLELEDTPRVVGDNVSNQPLLTTRLRSRVVVDSAIPQTSRDNPYLPGSREYIDAQSAASMAVSARMAGSSRQGNMVRLAQRLAQVGQTTPKIKPALPTDVGKAVSSADSEKQANRENVLDSLTGMLNKNSAASAYRSRTFGFGRSKVTRPVEVVVEDEKES